jgi:hypothetical protein
VNNFMIISTNNMAYGHDGLYVLVRSSLRFRPCRPRPAITRVHSRARFDYPTPTIPAPLPALSRRQLNSPLPSILTGSTLSFQSPSTVWSLYIQVTHHTPRAGCACDLRLGLGEKRRGEVRWVRLALLMVPGGGEVS